MLDNKAFTLVEFVFVIVAVGILAAIIIPRMQSSTLRVAADQVASHIRYTQHLAMMDDKFDPKDRFWFRRRWQIIFQSIEGYQTYSIFSDDVGGSTGNPDKDEIAVNPLNPSKILSGASSSGSVKYDKDFITKEMNLGHKYGITNVVFDNSCSPGIGANKARRIVFDYLGRPIKGSISSDTSPYPAGRLLTQECIITLTNDANENINITIQPETGYASVGVIY
jgi:prepilin-type N-terminal cleavage/methylation domain-containing protein